MDNVPNFEDFSINEETLQKVDQSALVKRITKSFDISDLKIYLKGFMLGLSLAERKKLTAWLDDTQYKKVIDYIIKNSENETNNTKLKTLLMALKKEG